MALFFMYEKNYKNLQRVQKMLNPEEKKKLKMHHKKCGQRTKCLVWNCKTMQLFIFFPLFFSLLCLFGFSCIVKILLWFLISHPSFIINFQLSVSRARHSRRDLMSQFLKTHTQGSHLFHYQFSQEREITMRRWWNELFFFVCARHFWSM